MTELFGPFIEYNPTAAMDDNKLTHVQNYINSIVENQLPFDDDDVFTSIQSNVALLDNCAVFLLLETSPMSLSPGLNRLKILVVIRRMKTFLSSKFLCICMQACT